MVNALYNGLMLPAEPRRLEYKGEIVTDEVNKEVIDLIMDLMFAPGLG